MIKIASTRGKAFNRVFTLLDENDQPLDLTGKAVSYKAKLSWHDPDPPLLVSVLVPLPQTGDTLGQAALQLDGSDTDLDEIPVDYTTTLRFDLEVEDSGETFVIDRGKHAVFPAVDR